MLTLLERYATLHIGDIADIESAVRQLLHPRLPSVVAWSLPRMAAILLACSYMDATTAQRFHGTKAAVCLLATFRAVAPWDDTHQRTKSAAVWLLGWQLDRCCVVLWHVVIYFCYKWEFAFSVVEVLLVMFALCSGKNRILKNHSLDSPRGKEISESEGVEGKTIPAGVCPIRLTLSDHRLMR